MYLIIGIICCWVVWKIAKAGIFPCDSDFDRKNREGLI